jgi:hypothetical protein
MILLLQNILLETGTAVKNSDNKLSIYASIKQLNILYLLLRLRKNEDSPDERGAYHKISNEIFYY